MKKHVVMRNNSNAKTSQLNAINEIFYDFNTARKIANMNV